MIEIKMKCGYLMRAYGTGKVEVYRLHNDGSREWITSTENAVDNLQLKKFFAQMEPEPQTDVEFVRDLAERMRQMVGAGDDDIDRLREIATKMEQADAIAALGGPL